MGDQSIPPPDGFAMRCATGSPSRTRALGARVARRLRGGEVLLLYGVLGSGKTCLVQGLGAALGVREAVISPTFTLVNRYAGRLVVYHLDFYRVTPADDLTDIGVEEILDEVAAGGAVLVAEWPQPLVRRVPRRIEMLAVLGAAPDERHWYWRGVPALPAAWEGLADEGEIRC